MDSQKNKQLTVAQGTSLTLSDRDKGIVKGVFRVNQLLDFPLGSDELMDWKDSIVQNIPDITPEEINKVVNGFMTGRYEYENKLGIRNIFNAIKLLRNGDQPISYFELP